uniref:Uncharacterized protein n=1 Tax=Anguilla anguilla TaxID=7936 RepID=A0A0E9RC99_ANGAN
MKTNHQFDLLQKKQQILLFLN